MNGLASLIRWRRFLLDERRKELAALRARAGELAEEGRRLAAAPRAEQPVVDRDAALGFALGGYIDAVLGRRRALAATEAKLGEEIAVAENAVADAFAELKRYEIAAERAAEATRIAAAATERRQLDELALDNHRRAQEPQA